MKLKFNEKIKDLDGNVLKDNGKELTLLNVATTSLLAVFDDERIDGQEKAKRGMLAIKIHSNPDVELTVEEIALIKRLIGKTYVPLVVARAYEIIEEGGK
jgi:hypothetical protein